MKRPGHTCFHCSQPTETQIQTREKRRRTYICREAVCWKAYYDSLPPLEAKKGRK